MICFQANFIAFLAHIGVQTVPTKMSFGVSRNSGEFEWSGASLSSVFAQRGNIFKLSMWRMLFDIIRFNTFARDTLETQSTLAGRVGREETLGSYLNREGYSQAFKDGYLLPMAAAVWSTSPDKSALDSPVVALVRFMYSTPSPKPPSEANMEGKGGITIFWILHQQGHSGSQSREVRRAMLTLS